MTGFEPVTSSTQNTYATNLRHIPNFLFNTIKILIKKQFIYQPVFSRKRADIYNIILNFDSQF